MNAKALFAMIVWGISQISYSQNVSDAVRWSFTNPGGTARTLGVGGSFGAMGGDFSVVNINPAGLGVYRKSEFTISPSLSNSKTISFIKGFNGQTTNDKYNSFSLDNISFVFTSNKNNPSSFAIGFSKIADLNKNFTYSGQSLGSITQRFAERANGKTEEELDDFEAYPALFVGAIYDIDKNQNYETDFGQFDEVNKKQQVEQEGYINELTIGWGKNIKNKLSVGISLGIPFVSFEEIKQYNEEDTKNEIPVFNNLNYTEFLNTSGIGTNIKAGFIYTPINLLRIGGAFHSPTWYTLNDDYYTNLDYSYNDGQNRFYENRSPDGSFKYRLNTPAKVVGSIGSVFKIGKKFSGFVNADAEWVDYNNNKFNFASHSDDPSEKLNSLLINNEIEQYLGSVLNLRLGTELAYGVVRLRGGIERGDSPLSADTDKITTQSFGIGIREDNFFIDLGVRIRKFTEGYVPYVLIDPSKETVVNNEINHTRIVVTAGFKF
ncbi:MAG: hypothetical protein RLZZ546_2028 [Bacteroidota bacterium]|jgi:hypothetical protein